MPNSSFYTARGDDGYTGLLGPERVPKYDPRPVAYGTVDEAQAMLGLARSSKCSTKASDIVLGIQHHLYKLMAELASSVDSPFAHSITSEHVSELEAWIAQIEADVEMPKEFVVPGDSPSGAALHVARTIVRRAERHAVQMLHKGLLANKEIIRYLNRLSSLLFVLAYYEDIAVKEHMTSLAKD